MGERGYDKEVEYQNNLQQIIKVNPKEMMEHHSVDKSEKIIEEVKKYLNKDVALENVAKSLYTLYEMTIIPEYVKEDDEIFFQGLAHLTKQYMGIDDQVSKVVSDMAKEIRDAISQD